MATLLELPDSLLGRVLNCPALSNEDGVRVACACTATHEAVEFRDIVVHRAGDVRDALVAARGRCETINCAENGRRGGYIDVAELAMVGRLRPDLVARLRAVRGWWGYYGTPLPLTRACFPALETVEVVNVVNDPSDEALSDPRIVLLNTTGTSCERFAHARRAPKCITLGAEQTVGGITRARDAGLRVDTVHLRNRHPWDDEMYAAAVPLASRALYVHGKIATTCNLDAMLRGVAPTVTELHLQLRAGLFAALETRYIGVARPAGGIALSINSMDLEPDFQEDDAAAIKRLIAAGVVASLDWTAFYMMDATSWSRLFTAASTTLTRVRMGPIALKDAITLLASFPPLPALKQLILCEKFEAGASPEGVALYRELGSRIAANAQSLRYLYVSQVHEDALRALASANPGVLVNGFSFNI